MEQVNIKDIAEAVGGILLWGDPEQRVAHISIDSRTMKGDDLFVPLIGGKVDAHRFIGQAFQAGAVATLTSEHDSRKALPAYAGAGEADTVDDGAERAAAQGGTEGAAVQGSAGGAALQGSAAAQGSTAAQSAAASGKGTRRGWIYVSDTKAALQKLGAWYRRRLALPLIGVTGSVGKTTTREMIGAALSARYKVYKTPGNSNSQVGVPITISQIASGDEIGVIELGVSEPGEMTKIAQVAAVDQAVITNIGVAHIEQLGSKEAICREKLHIQDGMARGGCLYVNGDDPILKTVRAKEGCRTVTYGTEEGLDYQAADLRICEGHPVFTAICKATKETAQVRLKVFGRHMVVNAMAALAVAGENGIPLREAAGALEEFQGFKGRQQIRTLRGITVIDDSYNASPVSMKAGIRVLCDMPAAGRRIAVLADMKELGEGSPDVHREIGHFLAGCGVDVVLLLGEMARLIGEQLTEDLDGARTRGGEEALRAEAAADTAGSGQQVLYFSDKQELERWLGAEVSGGDCVLFKGSNSMGLGDVIKAVFSEA